MLFKGVATALVTPFSSGEIDYPALKKLIDIQIAAGVDALVITGTTGEAPTISAEEKKVLYARAKEWICGRVPFIAGVGTNNTSEVIRLAAIAMEAGAQGLLINNPYYNKSSDEGILASYEAIGKEVDVPIIVYNVPSRTGKNISAALALELCKVRHIEAFKEANGDISQIVEFMSKKPESVAVYSGNDDQIVPLLSVGGSGVISTCSNIIPEKIVSITKAWFAGGCEEARLAQFAIIDLFKAVFLDANPIPLKTAMGLVGLCSEEMRLPLLPLSGAKLSALKEALARSGFTVAA
jgi:4-hydroxy-tetrahydrodipicolinate synthase